LTTMLLMFLVVWFVIRVEGESRVCVDEERRVS
jgi:hypothetical protein